MMVKNSKFRVLLSQVKQLNLPKGEYAIFGSGPMGVRNLRDCQDIDMIVTNKLFENSSKKLGWKNGDFERNGEYIQMIKKGEIELYKEWGPGKWNNNELIKDAEIIDGLPFVKLKYVLKWKKISGREKDKKDIKLINEYLENARNN